MRRSISRIPIRSDLAFGYLNVPHLAQAGSAGSGAHHIIELIRECRLRFMPIALAEAI